MMRLVETPEQLPVGSHSLSLYASPGEAARNMASFLKGARALGQPALVLSADDQMISLYREEAAKVVPELADSFRKLPGPHARETGDGLRPVPDALDFAQAHPGGGSMSGDTIPSFLDRRSLASILAYEDWFDSLRPFYHRGLCPYDLGRIPVERAPETFGRLAQAHTHAVLSSDLHPGARFLQLLVLPYVENPPSEHLGWLARAVDYGLIEEDRREGSVALTPRGENFARALLRLPEYAHRAEEATRCRRLTPSGVGGAETRPTERPEG
jgi:hypothetical protein